MYSNASSPALSLTVFNLVLQTPWLSSRCCYHPLPMPYKPLRVLPQTHWFYRATPKPVQASVQSAARPQGDTGCGRACPSVINVREYSQLNLMQKANTTKFTGWLREVKSIHFCISNHFSLTSCWNCLSVDHCESAHCCALRLLVL